MFSTNLLRTSPTNLTKDFHLFERPVEMICAPLLNRNSFDVAKHRDQIYGDLRQVEPDFRPELPEVVRCSSLACDKLCSSESESASLIPHSFKLSGANLTRDIGMFTIYAGKSPASSGSSLETGFGFSIRATGLSG